jgi:WD40 repeat protein
MTAQSASVLPGEDRQTALQERAELRRELEKAKDQYQQAQLTIAALRNDLARLESLSQEQPSAAGSKSPSVKSNFADLPLEINDKIESGKEHIATDCRDFAFFRPDILKPSALVLLRDSDSSANRSGAGDIAIYAFEIRDGKLSWSQQGKEGSLRSIEAITSGFDQDVIAYKSDIGFGIVRPGDWWAELKGKSVNQITLPREPPSHRKFPVFSPESENLESALAVKGALRFAIAKHHRGAVKGKEQAETPPNHENEIDVVQSWDQTESSPRFVFDVSQHGELSRDRRVIRVRAMSFAPTSDRLVVCYEEEEHLVVLDPPLPQKPGPPELTLLVHSSPVRCFDFSPDGVWLVSIDEGDALHCWKMSENSPKLLYKNLGISVSRTTCLALSRDRPGLLATGDHTGKVTIWRFPPDGKEPGPPRKLRQFDHVGEVLKLEFSADGSVLAGLALTTKNDGLKPDRPRPRGAGMVRIWPCTSLEAP